MEPNMQDQKKQAQPIKPVYMFQPMKVIQSGG